jgi:CHAT domain-containing protein
MLAEAHALYRQLLGPAEAALAGRERLHVVAVDVTGRLPFEMLLTGPPAAGAALSDMPWLVRRHAVQIVPSPAAILARGGRPAAPGAGYVGLGAPDYRHSAAVEFRDIMTRAVEAMPPLPEAAGEVQGIAALFPGARWHVLTGAEASEKALAELAAAGAFERLRVLHFATHGAHQGDAGPFLQPTLALTPLLRAERSRPAPPGGWRPREVWDGALEASEILTLGLRADLVLLSACNTAASPLSPLDGLGGLAVAFLRTGSHHVLGSHWPVNSRAAVEIVAGMAGAPAGLDDPAGALRHAVLGLIGRGGERAHPAYWAPFSVIGGP